MPKRSGEALAEIYRHMNIGLEHSQKARRFEGKSFSKRTIEALACSSVDEPERLLFMDEASIRSIPGVGKVGLEEIRVYRAKFVP